MSTKTKHKTESLQTRYVYKTKSLQTSCLQNKTKQKVYKTNTKQ